MVGQVVAAGRENKDMQVSRAGSETEGDNIMRIWKAGKTSGYCE